MDWLTFWYFTGILWVGLMPSLKCSVGRRFFDTSDISEIDVAVQSHNVAAPFFI